MAAHDAAVDRCGNDVMARILEGLRATTSLFEINRLKDWLKPDSREHLAILDAIMVGDEAGARRAATLHIQSLIDFVIGPCVDSGDCRTVAA